MAESKAEYHADPELAKGGKPPQEMIDRVNEYHDEQRATFVRKVYTVLLIQLSFTCAMCYVAISTDWIQADLKANMWRFWVASGFVIVQSFFMCICKCIVTKCPFNVLALITFTLLQTYIVATITTFFSKEVIFVAAAIVLVGVAAATLYSCIFAEEVRTSTAVLFLAVLTGVGCAVAWWFIPNWIVAIAIVGIVCFGISLYLIVHTKTLAYDPDLDTLEEGSDDYLYGALKLYTDVILIFVAMLNCVKKCKDKVSPA